jgi:hypothetical protein
MFSKETAYKFEYTNHSKEKKSEYEIVNHILTFNCRFNQQYIVNVEEYPNDVFVIKFHLKSHTRSDKKYSLTTNLNDMGRVVATCLTIMMWFLTEKNPKASFGFVGANSIDEKGTSKRFKIYERLMSNVFSPLKFAHYTFLKSNAYLLLNRDKYTTTTELEKGLENITQMFESLYEI